MSAAELAADVTLVGVWWNFDGDEATVEHDGRSIGQIEHQPGGFWVAVPPGGGMGRPFAAPEQAVRWLCRLARPVVYAVRRGDDPVFPWVLTDHNGVEIDRFYDHGDALDVAHRMARHTTRATEES